MSTRGGRSCKCKLVEVRGRIFSVSPQVMGISRSAEKRNNNVSKKTHRVLFKDSFYEGVGVFV